LITYPRTTPKTGTPTVGWRWNPSYKQYEYKKGLDAIAISGIDPEQLAQSFIDSEG